MAIVRKLRLGGLREALDAVCYAHVVNASNLVIDKDSFTLDSDVKLTLSKEPLLDDLLSRVNITPISVSGDVVLDLHSILGRCHEIKKYLRVLFVHAVSELPLSTTKDGHFFGVPVVVNGSFLREGEILYGLSSIPFGSLRYVDTLLKGEPREQ